MYALLRAIVRLLALGYLAGLFHASGFENIPPTGPYVVCANHIGTIDPALLPAFVYRNDSWSMAKAESLAKPGFGSWVLRNYHAFGVVRHTADRGALRRARDILHGGGVLVIYPEGHRGWDGRLQRAEPGAAFLARSARVPVLPVGIVGTNECLPPGAKLPRRRRVELHFGAPFLLRERLPDGTKIGNQEAADAIMLAIATLLPPAMHGAYADPTLLPAAAAGAAEPVR